MIHARVLCVYLGAKRRYINTLLFLSFPNHRPGRKQWQPTAGWITYCGLTACTPGSAPGPMLSIEYGKPLPLLLPVTLAMKIILQWRKIILLQHPRQFLANKPATLKHLPSDPPKKGHWSLLGGIPESEALLNHKNNSHQLWQFQPNNQIISVCPSAV